MPGGVSDFALGFRPLSTLLMNMYATDHVFEGHNSGANMFAMGVGNFPSYDGEYDTHFEVDTHNNNAGAYTFHAGETGSNWSFFDFFNASITPGPEPLITGGGLYSDIVDHMQPYPTFIDTTARFSLDTNPSRSSAIMMTCEASVHGVTSPEVGDTNVYTARSYLEDVEAVLFFGCVGHQFQSTAFGWTPAYGFGVLTEDYQGCVAYDRRNNSGGNPAGFFQSKQLCHATSLWEGVRASSGEILNGNQVHLTGEIASSVGGNAMVMQMFGRDIDMPDMFIMEV